MFPLDEIHSLAMLIAFVYIIAYNFFQEKWNRKDFNNTIASIFDSFYNNLWYGFQGIVHHALRKEENHAGKG